MFEIEGNEYIKQTIERWSKKIIVKILENGKKTSNNGYKMTIILSLGQFSFRVLVSGQIKS